MNKSSLGWAIILSALLVEVPRFMVINWRIEQIANEPAGWVGFSVGIGMGLVIPLGTAYVFDAWRSTRKDSRAWKILLVAFLSFLVAEALMLTPYIEGGISGVGIIDVLRIPWLRTLWSLVTALAPLGVVAGVAYAMPSGKSASQSARRAVAQPAHSGRKASQKVPCPHCDRSVTDTTNGWNAHSRWCQPTNGRVREGNPKEASRNV